MIVALLLMVAMPMMAERVSPETARKVAQTFLNNNGAKSAQLTDLSKAAGFANLYIFNGEEGFVVMAADDCVKPILGYSLTGKFVAEGMPENVRGWLQGYDDEIQYAIDSKMKATGETTRLWKALVEGNNTKAAKVTAVIEPLIQTKWNQGSPFNNFCPLLDNRKTVTGCVATAMAQVMNYWQYPSMGVGSHSYLWTKGNQELSANFGATEYDWNNMTNTYNSSSTDAQKIAVATLMHHCGVSVDMNYDYSQQGTSHSGSGAITAYVADALKIYFNYSSEIQHLSRSAYSDSDWINMLKEDLDLNRPIQYHGSGSGGGHSFVCDGYNSDDYFHFNWGWSGNCDAYYTINNLNPGPGGIGSGSYGIYNDGQGAIFGVHPSANDAMPSNLTYTLTGLHNLTLSWTAANGAASYNIYRNSILVGNTTETTYTETAPFGNNVYYIRSVDANGELSLSSNTVTVTIAYQTPIVNDLGAALSGNDVVLNWTAPEWCYPETPTGTLTYGTQIKIGSLYPWGENSMYWGHRHLASTLTNYDGMKLYSVEFYISEPGEYQICIYNGTTTGTYTCPQTSICSSPTVNFTDIGWHSIGLTTPVVIDATQDLWVFVHNPQPIAELKSYLCTDSDQNAYGVYYSANPSSYTHNNAPGYAFLLKTYLTDGTYTYNLYDGTTTVASNINATNYTVSNVTDNAAHQYTVKTNYYGGESAASNMAGLTLGTASLSSLELGENDKMTVTEGSELTVGGTLTNTNPANLILENGAELVHNTEDVQATVKKTITPPSNDDHGWYFIASPVTDVTPTADNGFLNGAYDLYYYNEPTHYWMNYKSSAFSLMPQKGYLYANEDGTTLQFTGTLTPSNNSVTINDLSHIASSLNGFNLVGNPFACNATVNKDFYVVDNTTGKVILASNGSEIAPCAGIFVKATANDASVTFTKATSRVEPSSSSFDIVVKREAQPTRDGVATGSTTLDRARVRLGDAETLEKFSIGDGEGCVIYFPQNGQDLAVAYANGENEMPLNFKAAKNGIYTLAFEVENLDLDYLHLIDNMTGGEVDVLAMPNYSFEAKTSDYASRFRLVFAENETDGPSADEQPFAYYANGEIRIVADACDASLQVVDMMGRVIVSTDVARNVSTSGMPAGVYVLRLVSGDGVRTQKIVVD